MLRTTQAINDINILIPQFRMLALGVKYLEDEVKDLKKFKPENEQFNLIQAQASLHMVVMNLAKIKLELETARGYLKHEGG